MGVSIGLFINHRWEVRDIQDTLESLYGKVTYVASHTPDMAILTFDYSPTEHREMFVHINSETAGFKGIHINFNANYGHSKEIMEAIAKRLGGFLNYEDVNDNYVAFPTCGQGDLDFFVKHAISHGETNGRDIEEFAKNSIALSDKIHAASRKRTDDFMQSIKKQNRKPKV
jgi:hypothetical protein